MEAKEWTVKIFLTEDDNDDVTTAKAVLFTRQGKRHETIGVARRNPMDQPVPEIGDELAVSRALNGLAHDLLEATVADVWANDPDSGRPHIVPS